MTKVVTIAAKVDKKRVLCRVSLEIIRDKFGASEEPMQSIAKHRPAIQEAARNLMEKDAYEEDGSILIREYDL